MYVMYLLLLHREERYTPKVGLFDVKFIKFAGFVCSWGTLSADGLAKTYLASKKN